MQKNLQLSTSLSVSIHSQALSPFSSLPEPHTPQVCQPIPLLSHFPFTFLSSNSRFLAGVSVTVGVDEGHGPAADASTQRPLQTILPVGQIHAFGLVDGIPVEEIVTAALNPLPHVKSHRLL